MEDVRTLSFVETTMWMSSFVEAMVAETLLSTGKSLASLLLVTGSLLTDVNSSVSPKLTAMDGRFPFEDLYRGKNAYLENKNASETEDDEDDEDDDDANDEEEDGEDEDYSGEEGEQEGDPEDDPEANGEGESEDGDDDDGDDGDKEDDDEDGEDEEDEEEEDEEAPQPPSKKRK